MLRNRHMNSQTMPDQIMKTNQIYLHRMKYMYRALYIPYQTNVFNSIFWEQRQSWLAGLEISSCLLAPDKCLFSWDNYFLSPGSPQGETCICLHTSLQPASCSNLFGSKIHLNIIYIMYATPKDRVCTI